jgi:hypothetical protein
MQHLRASAALRVARRIAAYAWASPNTLLGLTAGLVVLASGGRVRPICGTLEFSGGCLGRLAAAPASFPFCAITLGHVILGVSDADLDAVRRHEHVHVAQYEAWGPLFLPAYVGSSAWQVVQGRHAYRENYFERQAFCRSER